MPNLFAPLTSSEVLLISRYGTFSLPKKCILQKKRGVDEKLFFGGPVPGLLHTAQSCPLKRRAERGKGGRKKIISGSGTGRGKKGQKDAKNGAFFLAMTNDSRGKKT